MSISRVAHVCILLHVLLHVLVHVAGAFEGCMVQYGRRACRHRVLEGVLVTCDGQGREQNIPTNVPQDTKFLSLVNFKLTTLHKKDFTENIQTVECLQIVDSGITKIEPDAFSSMASLKELTLENTNIRSESLAFVNHASFEPVLLSIQGSQYLDRVDFEATVNLNSLKTLNLARNRITQINKDIFEELKSLESLDFSENKLHTLHWRELKKLEFLNALYLNGNKFQSVPIDMYGVFFAVNELALADNPFHCNCHLRWLREFYNMVFDKEVDFPEVECASPRRKKFGDLSVHSFKCTEPEEPTITYHQIDDKRFEFNCTSHGDPSPTLTVTLPDGVKLVTPPSSDLSKLHPRTPQILTKSGSITCNATNTKGSISNLETLPYAVPLSGVTRLDVMNYITLFLLSAVLSLLIGGL